MKLVRNHYPHFPVPLSTTGSDACESFFSKVRGMIRNERCYDGCDLLGSVGALNRIAEFQAKKCLKFPTTHSKQENIWAHFEETPGLATANLGDYSLIQTDEVIVGALQRGFEDAKCLCLQLDMHCKSKTNDSWWDKPWKSEDFVHLETVAQSEVEDLDEVSEVTNAPTNVVVVGEDEDSMVVET